jgi:hypothetical protein
MYRFHNTLHKNASIKKAKLTLSKVDQEVDRLTVNITKQEIA